MLFNLSWNDRKSKITIAIIDEDESPTYIYIKKDLSNAFNKKMIKKIIKKLTLKKSRLNHYQIMIENKSDFSENEPFFHSINTLKMILKELLEDIIYELKLSFKEKVYV